MNRRMTDIVLSAVAACAAALAPSALAQTGQTTATIVGYVSDAATQKAVPGALVVATSPELQGEQTVVTDDDGEYEFTNIPPGVYKVHVELANYKPFDQTEIGVRLLSRVRVNIPLAPETVTMEVQVVQTQAPVIDVGRATVGSSMTGEELRAMPLGFGGAAGANSTESAALVAPSAQPDLFGVSFAGSSSPENNTIIDGIPVTNTAFGTTGFALGLDFVKEESVSTAGFMPEFGRASGGIVNIVTKSGGNEYHGSAFLYIIPTGPLGPPVSRAAEAIGAVGTNSGVLGTSIGTLQVGAEVGGPILKDKLWFYVGFMPTFGAGTLTRYLQPIVDNGNGQPKLDSSGNQIVAPCNPNAAEYSSSSYQGPKWTDPTNPCQQTDTSKKYGFYGQSYFMLGKLTYALSQNHSISVEAIGQPSYGTNASGGNGTPLAVFDNTNSTQYMFAGKYNGKFLDRHLSVDATLSYFRTQNGLSAPNETVTDSVTGKQVTYNPLTEPAVVWQNQHSLTEFENDPTTLKLCQDAPGASYVKCPVVNYTTGGAGFYDTQDLQRLYGQLSVTGLFKLGGNNALKGGVDYEQVTFGHVKQYSGGNFELENNFIGPTTYLDFREYGYQKNPNDPNSAVILPNYTNNSKSVNTGLFIQDSFDFARLITLNAGVRWELQNMYGTGDKPAISIADNIAPRFQLIVDPTRQGRSKVYAHWGRYYESIPLDLTDRQFPSEQSVEAFRSQCVVATPTVAGSPGRCPIVPGVFGANANYGYIGAGNTPIAPGLQGEYNDVWGIGAAYEILPDMSLELSYLDSTMGRVIEDMSVDDGTTYFIANPGSSSHSQVPVTNSLGQTSIATIDGKTATTYISTPGGSVPVQVAWPQPMRRYQAVTLELKKQLSRQWEVDAQYTYSASYGNYQGLFKSSTGQLDPNITSEYDLVMLMANKYGPLPADSPHHILLRGTYSYDITPTVSVTAGGLYIWQSGSPINVLGAHELYGPGESFVLPRGAGGRLPPFWSLDLRAGVDWVFAKPFKLRFQIDCFNVTNRQVKQAVDENYTFDPVYPIANGTMADLKSLKNSTNGNPVVPNSNFMNATAYQQPRSFRFNLAVIF